MFYRMLMIGAFVLLCNNLAHAQTRPPAFFAQTCTGETATQVFYVALLDGKMDSFGNQITAPARKTWQITCVSHNGQNSVLYSGVWPTFSDEDGNLRKLTAEVYLRHTVSNKVQSETHITDGTQLDFHATQKDSVGGIVDVVISIPNLP